MITSWSAGAGIMCSWGTTVGGRSDAWIFVAGRDGQRRRPPPSARRRRRRPEGVRLTDVLSMADHLNRALPGRAEVEAAVRRLSGAGLVSVADGWFRVTAAGEQLWRNRPRRRGRRGRHGLPVR